MDTAVITDPRDRVLDWGPNHDPESRNYAIRSTITGRPRRRNKLWRPGPVMDQGREGACVGFGWTAEALSTPVPVNLARVAKATTPHPDLFALDLYRRAQRIDEWAGENYEGTSVNAGGKAMREMGLIKEWRWCFGIEDVIDSILAKGPVVLGINWYEGMYWAPNGILTPGGPIVGGHCILAAGYRVNDARLDGSDGIILQNSWGTDWGIEGRAVIKVDHLATLLRQDGEAALATRRSYGLAA